LATTGLRNTVLIFGITSFFVFLAVTFLFACCTPCIAAFAGAGAGWLAAYWTGSKDQNAAVRAGAAAGALSGLGALVGQLVGAILSARMITPEMISDAYEMVTQFYQSLGPEGFEIPSTEFVTRAAIFTQAGCGVVNIGIMAGLGALAGLLYFRYRSSRNLPPDAYNGLR
jgi:hypothetical protein